MTPTSSRLDLTEEGERLAKVEAARDDLLRLLREFISHDGSGTSLSKELADICTATRRMIALEQGKSE